MKKYLKKTNQNPNSVSRTCAEANFFISPSAFPKEGADEKTQLGPARRMGQRGETYTCAAPARAPVRNLMMFPIMCHLGEILEPEQLAVRRSRKQSLKSRLMWSMAGLWPGWDLVPGSPPARCTCTVVLGTC